MTPRTKPLICPGCELMIRLCECDEQPAPKPAVAPTGFYPGQKAVWHRWGFGMDVAELINVEVVDIRGDKVKVSTSKRRRPVWIKANNLEAT